MPFANDRLCLFAKTMLQGIRESANIAIRESANIAIRESANIAIHESANIAIRESANSAIHESPRLYRNSRSIVLFSWPRHYFNYWLKQIHDLGDLRTLGGRRRAK